MNKPNPSQMAINAFPRLKVELNSVAKKDSTCSMCGRPILAGEPVQLGKFSQKFTDYNRLAAPHSPHVCLWCASTIHADAMRTLKQCVITATGKAYSLSKDSHRQWFFTDPPEAPFVVLMAESLTASSHLVWHATATLSKNLIKIQNGHTTLTIDRLFLMELVDFCKEASDLAKEAGVKISAPHPFASLDRNLEGMQHGTLRRDVAEVLQATERGQFLLHELLQASEGELFALATLVKTNPAEPLQEELN